MKYELSFIISPVIPETDHPKVNQEVLDYLKKVKAEVVSEPYFIGRKKLAYSIKKQKHGFYVFLEFSLEDKAGLKELETLLKHSNAILRHLVVKMDKAAEQAKVDPSVYSDKKEKPVAPRKPVVRKASPKAAKAEPKVEDKKEDKPKVELGDIDKQLDDILEKGPKVD